MQARPRCAEETIELRAYNAVRFRTPLICACTLVISWPRKTLCFVLLQPFEVCSTVAKAGRAAGCSLSLH